MKTVRVQLGSRSYPIVIGGSLSSLPSFVKRVLPGRTGMIVADRAVARTLAAPLERSFRAKGFQVWLHTVPSGEGSKRIREWENLLRHCARRRLERGSFLIALGGGVVGDLTGFAAASYLRGISVIQVPTTLLAMVDSAIGGKTGLDIPEGKNLAGAFHQPAGVWVAPEALETLPVPHLRNGMAEVVKYGVIQDAAFFDFLEDHLADLYNLRAQPLLHALETCARIKARVVSQDEREATGRRAALNFGHTIGHALEAAFGFRRLLHGEAVAIGMHAAGFISWRTGRWGLKEFHRMLGLIARAGLPCRLKLPVPACRVKAFLKRDKKVRDGQALFVLPDRVGKVTAGVSVPDAVLNEALKEIGVR